MDTGSPPQCDILEHRTRVFAHAWPAFIATALLCGCATPAAVTPLVEKKLAEPSEGSMRDFTRENAAWEKSVRDLDARYSALQKNIESSSPRFRRIAQETETLQTQVRALTNDFKSRLESTGRKVRQRMTAADVKNADETLHGMRDQEKEFPSHRRRCSETCYKIGRLHGKQQHSITIFAARSTKVCTKLGAEKAVASSASAVALPPINRRRIAFDIPPNVDSWMALAQVLIDKGSMKPLHPSVEALIALDPQTLKSHEERRQSPGDVFLTRALRNYLESLTSLKAACGTLQEGWQPVWDSEKALLKHSGERPAPLRWMREDSFREGMINKAYVYDALIRSRGGTTDAYDRFEMSYYLGEMIWAAKKLGHPYGDEIERLANDYLSRLSARAPLAVH